MPQKQKAVKNPTPKKGNQGGITPLLHMAITRCQNRLESCSNPCCGPHGARIHRHFGDVTVPFTV